MIDKFTENIENVMDNIYLEGHFLQREIKLKLIL